MLWDVCEEHLDEAAWRMGQWEKALEAPDFVLAEAAAYEEKARAHISGLVAGGEKVRERLLLPTLEEEEVARVATAALALVEGRKLADEVRWLLRAASGEAQRVGVQRALQLCEWKGVGEALLPLLGSHDAQIQAAAFEVLAFRGEVPANSVADFLSHPEARIRVAALRVLGPQSLAGACRRPLALALDSAHPDSQLAAVEVGLAASLREAWRQCGRMVEATGRQNGEALLLWALGCGEEELALLLGLLREPGCRPAALWALGFSGRLAAADACLQWMEDSTVGKLAGEAFSAITGLQLEGPYVLPDEEEAPSPPPEEDDLDADLVPHATDFLPRPATSAIAAWWKEARGHFAIGTRYLGGLPFSGEALLRALEEGPMRRRHVWARELAIRTRGTCRVATRAFARRQLADLARARRDAEHMAVSPFLKMAGQ